MNAFFIVEKIYHYTLQESVIDIRSTIKVLAPKLTRDTRPAVLVRKERSQGQEPDLLPGNQCCGSGSMWDP